MTSNKRRLLAGLVLFLLALACNEHGLIPADEAIEAEKQDGFTQLETNQIDILFVIDNSGSMCQEQSALTDNFDAFIEGIAEINADFRIAVVTTDMERDNGQFQVAPGLVGDECSDAPPLSCPPSTGPVLSAGDYGFDPEDPNTGLNVAALQEDFRCIATVGTDGTGFESGLEAMTTALSTDLLETVNAGFRRSEAWLAIIFVTDENDCSAPDDANFVNGNECEWNRDDLTPVSAFTDFLLSYPGTAEGERVLVAGIIGPDNELRPVRPENPRPSCSGDLGDAFPGYRYEEVLDAFGERSAQANICQDSFDVALDQITSVIRSNLAIKCLRDPPPTCEGPLDCDGDATCGAADPAEPGGMRVCSDFDIIVERPNEAEEWAALSDDDYDIIYNATSCSRSGVGIEFAVGQEPGAGAQFRIRYPVTINIGSAGDNSSGESAE